MKILRTIIRYIVRILAVMMTILIVLGAVDVGWIMYQAFMAAPRYIVTISDMLAIFGAFMAVLIAIEIFVNIVLYLRDDVIHVKIVMATALMAIARKVIILDLDKYSSSYLFGVAAVVLAMSVGYWLIHQISDESQLSHSEVAADPLNDDKGKDKK
jgi:uncharacterized membrane protein (DUF373 family)